MVSKKIKNGAFWLGVAGVIASHVAILAMGLSLDQVVPHATLNLIAAGLLVFSRSKL